LIFEPFWVTETDSLLQAFFRLSSLHKRRSRIMFD
jgi:hypothetical protein